MRKKEIVMSNPAHPGEIFLEEVLKPLEVSVTEAAAVLGVSRQALSALVNSRSDLSAEMAFRIEKAFGPNAELMMRIQNAYSMARARRRKEKILDNVRVFRSEKRRRNLAKTSA